MQPQAQQQEQQFQGTAGDHRAQSAWDQSNLVSKCFLLYMYPLTWRGQRGKLDMTSLTEPCRAHQSDLLGDELEDNYKNVRNNNNNKGKSKLSLVRALFKANSVGLLTVGLLDFTSKCIMGPLQILSLGWLIDDSSAFLRALAANATLHVSFNQTTPVLISERHQTATGGHEDAHAMYRAIVFDGLLLVAATCMFNFISHLFFLWGFYNDTKFRAATCNLIYRKALKLSQAAMVETSPGQMVNLLSNDVNRFEYVTEFTIYMLTCPLQAIWIIFLMAYVYLGTYATLASLVIIGLYLCIQSVVSRAFARLRFLTASRTDRRMRVINEAILAIRVIKMYAWEQPFMKLVHTARSQELRYLGFTSALRGLNHTLFHISSKIVVFAALLGYLLAGNKLDPKVVFVTMGLGNMLRMTLTYSLPWALSSLAECLVALKRIEQFLELPENEGNAISANYQHFIDTTSCGSARKLAIKCQQVCASWALPNLSKFQQSFEVPILRQLSLNIEHADLVLVVGRVGAGKSSFLMSLIGELQPSSGRLQVNGRLSYAPQEAWIFPGTVRDNILLAEQFEPKRYEQVIRVCCLERDFDLMPERDLTIVGERGASLSGGQKARVNLARVLYKKADLYLLDDPLSAVDAPVAKTIVDTALRGFLRAKTVVLATHQLQFLRHANKVLLLDRKQPAAFGSLEQVMASQAFEALDFGRQAFEDAANHHEASSAAPAADESQQPQQQQQQQQQLDLLQVPTIKSCRSASKPSLVINKQTSVGVRQGVENEELPRVSANMSAYNFYLSQGFTWLTLPAFLILNWIAQAILLYIDYFLTLWTDSVQRKELLLEQGKPTSGGFFDSLDVGQATQCYALLVATCCVFSIGRTSLFYRGSLRASRRIHRALFNSILGAPMAFFDFKPIGIILNRVCRDIGYVDATMPTFMLESLITLFYIIGVLVITIIVDTSNALPSVFLLTIALAIRWLCSRTIIRLKQMEGIAKSPMYSHLSVSLNGLASIRAFRVQAQFQSQFERHLNLHTSAIFTFFCSNRMLCLSVDIITHIFITIIVCMHLFGGSLETSNTSMIGLLLAQLINMPNPLRRAMRQIVELESEMVSVQRIKELSELEPEDAEAKRQQQQQSKATKQAKEEGQEKTNPNPNPNPNGAESVAIVCQPARCLPQMAAGRLVFKAIKLRYLADKPQVLHELSFSLRPREKVGVVGRTGAGKSSLIAVLFRLYPFEGTVELDGLDTKRLDLRQLRSAISIIPQEPVLFTGTLRKNLDPFGGQSDAELWDALEAVQLKPLFERSERMLEFELQEAGSNLSVGQRQLVCLARAILRKSKILVLDEATANVDPETDSLIQRTIAQQFANCTVITIAHRLLTVIDSDRVLVLERGRLVEFGEPSELAADPNSHFSNMIDSQAEQMARIRQLIASRQSSTTNQLPTKL